VNREILRLALPNILSNLSVPLLGSVDTALMGHLSADHLAALGVAGMMLMFFYGNMGFLRMGTTGLSAQALGAGEPREWSLVLWRALTVAGGLGVLLIALQGPLFELGAWVMHLDSGYEDLAREYFSIRIWTAPAVLGLLGIMGFFFGMQNARYPLYITLVVNGVNILLSLYLVRVWDLGIAGAAWGSVAAQYTGLALGLWLLLRRCRHTIIFPRLSAVLDPEGLGRFFHVNRNIFIRTVALTFSLVYFYGEASRISELALSAMIVMMQFLIWMSFAVDGFANAAESLVGRAYGARDRRSFEAAVRVSLAWGGVLALLFACLYGVWGADLAALFTDDPKVLATIGPLLPWAALLPLLSFAAFIFDGIFVGMTAVLSMRNSVLAAMAIFLIAARFLPLLLDPMIGLWLAFMLFFFLRGILLGWIFYRKGWDAP